MMVEMDRLCPREAFKPGLPEIKEKSGIENLVPVG